MFMFYAPCSNIIYFSFYTRKVPKLTFSLLILFISYFFRVFYVLKKYFSVPTNKQITNVCMLHRISISFRVAYLYLCCCCCCLFLLYLIIIENYIQFSSIKILNLSLSFAHILFLIICWDNAYAYAF